VSGSTDNTAVIWHIPSGKDVQRMHHGNYVQGVAYDPRGIYIASQSSDRTLQVFSSKKDKLKKKENGEFHLLHSINKKEFEKTQEENNVQVNRKFVYKFI
jgi:WD40 repeat protein